MTSRIIGDPRLRLPTRRRTEPFRPLHINLHRVPIYTGVSEILHGIELERMRFRICESVDTCGTAEHSTGADGRDGVVCGLLRRCAVLPVSPGTEFLLILAWICGKNAKLQR